MSKLTIGYFADGPWSHLAFERIISDDSIQIKFIVPRTDSSDTTLLNYSKKYQIPYHKGIRVNSEDFYQLAATYQCDLFVSMSFNQIFKARIINLPRLGTINCHAGKLPFYRGRNILNWALINDEHEFGITVHYVDEGIDTGDILLQRTFSITDKDNYKTLLERSYVECAEILYESIKQLQAESFTQIKQKDIHSVGFYCGPRGEGDEIINWNQSSRRLFNFIRALCEPGPKATTFLKEKVVRINKARMIDNAPIYIGTPGQIVGVNHNGFVVKSEDSTIEILEVDSGAKIKLGDKLGK